MGKQGTKDVDTFVISVKQSKHFDALKVDIQKSPFSNRTDYFIALIDTLQSIPPLFDEQVVSRISLLERLRMQSAFITSLPLEKIGTLAEVEHRSREQMILYLIDVGIRCFPKIDSFRTITPNSNKLLT